MSAMAAMRAKFRACTIMPVLTSPFLAARPSLAAYGFKCADTQELFETDRSQQFGSIRKLATRKLGMLDAAATLKDLESPRETDLRR